MYVEFSTPAEITQHIATLAKEKRLSLNLSQRGLSERSGVSLSVLKQFERTGKISLESLLKLALPLGNLNDFLALFKPVPPQMLPSLDSLLNQKTRKRGRK